jgi:hypothetical protein
MTVTTVRRREISPQHLLYIPSRDFTLVWPRRVFVDCGTRLDSKLWTINTAFLRLNHLVTFQTHTLLALPALPFSQPLHTLHHAFCKVKRQG